MPQRSRNIGCAAPVPGRSNATPHFALVTTDGDALGTIELGRPDWPDGAIIYRGEKPNLRVVGQLATDRDFRS